MKKNLHSIIFLAVKKKKKGVCVCVGGGGGGGGGGPVYCHMDSNHFNFI